VNYPPKVSVSSLVNSLKGVSSYVLRRRLPRIAKCYSEECFCGRLLISPHPVAAHHSTSSSATLNSRPHRYSRGSPRPEVRGLRQGQADLGVTWRSAAELVFSPAIGGLFPTSDHGELFRHH